MCLESVGFGKGKKGVENVDLELHIAFIIMQIPTDGGAHFSTRKDSQRTFALAELVK